jgi:hypothetical protein
MSEGRSVASLFDIERAAAKEALANSVQWVYAEKRTLAATRANGQTAHVNSHTPAVDGLPEPSALENHETGDKNRNSRQKNGSSSRVERGLSPQNRDAGLVGNEIPGTGLPDDELPNRDAVVGPEIREENYATEVVNGFEADSERQTDRQPDETDLEGETEEEEEDAHVQSLRNIAEDMPSAVGVYIWRTGAQESDEVLYVGKAKRLRERVRSYFARTASSRVRAMVRRARYIEFLLTPGGEHDALLLEARLIKQHMPRYVFS